MTDSKTQHRGGAGSLAENRERAAEAKAVRISPATGSGRRRPGIRAASRAAGISLMTVSGPRRPGKREARPAMAAKVSHRPWLSPERHRSRAYGRRCPPIRLLGDRVFLIQVRRR
jgi:hypothetical protein